MQWWNSLLLFIGFLSHESHMHIWVGLHSICEPQISWDLWHKLTKRSWWKGLYWIHIDSAQGSDAISSLCSLWSHTATEWIFIPKMNINLLLCWMSSCLDCHFLNVGKEFPIIWWNLPKYGLLEIGTYSRLLLRYHLINVYLLS
jgi:hypothetical protein